MRTLGRMRGRHPPYPVKWQTVTFPTVGADAYPKGTCSGSRSYLAGRHWRPARLRARRQIAEKTSSFDEVFLSMEYEKAGLLFYQMDSDAWK